MANASFLFLFLFVTFAQTTFSQDNVEYFPQGLTFKPLYSNLLEPRAGSSFVFGENRLRLDIGTSADLLRINYANGNKLSIGSDFFTWTRLRKNEDFKFPVIAVDYLFGVNAAYIFMLGDMDAGVRFRFSHISAHLVDGQYSNENGTWRDSSLPFVYSREFVEFFPAVSISESMRMYVGVTYMMHSIPEDVKKTTLQAGAEKYFSEISIANLTPFLMYDFKLAGNAQYLGNHSITAGIKAGNYKKAGFSVYYNYISGNSVHGMFYNKFESYTSLGFNVDI